MNNNINLIDISNACYGNATINNVIEKLNLINYKINLEFNGTHFISIVIIIDKNLLLYSEIKCNKNNCDLFNSKVVNGWQFKITR